MRKRRAKLLVLNILPLLLLVMATLFGPAAASSRAEEPVIILRLSTFIPPAHPASKLFQAFAKELESASHNRVKVEYYGTSSLGGAKEQYEITVEGLADLAVTCCAYKGSRFPLALGVQLPLFTDSAETGTQIIMELMRQGFFKREFADSVYLFPLATTPSRVFSNKKITKVEDFHGLRIFGGESVFIDVCDQLGATPITMSTPDVYMAMQRRTLDAGVAPWTPAIAAWRWQEVARYAIDVPILSGWHCNMVMHRESWERIPEDIKKAWRPLFPQYAIKFARLYQQLDSIMKAKCAKYRGCEIIEFPESEIHKLAERMVPVWQKWIADNGTEGRRFYRAYVEIMQRLGKKVWVKLPGLYDEPQ
jgi:TRAP-type C4-dicarboxylate transport system substrate-binding protein